MKYAAVALVFLLIGALGMYYIAPDIGKAIRNAEGENIVLIYLIKLL